MAREPSQRAATTFPRTSERAGPFNPDGNNGFNIEHLRDFNNAAPKIGLRHGDAAGPRRVRARAASTPIRATTSAASTDRLGRRHDLRRHRRLRRADRRRVGRAARRRSQLLVLRQLRLAQPRQLRPRRPPLDAGLLPRRVPAQPTRWCATAATSKLRPQTIVDGLRTGNNFAASGQLIDRLAFVACASYPGPARRSDASVEAIAVDGRDRTTPTSTAAAARRWARS